MTERMAPYLLPILPRPSVPDPGLAGEVVAGMGGAESAHRAVRSAAGRWLMEGQLALMDWDAPEADERP